MQSIIAVTGAARAYSSKRKANVMMYSVQHAGNAAVNQPTWVEAADAPNESIHAFLVAIQPTTVGFIAALIESERHRSYVAVPAEQDLGVRIIVPGSTCEGYVPIGNRERGKTQWATPDMETIYRLPLEHRLEYEQVTDGVRALLRLAISVCSGQSHYVRRMLTS